LAHLDNQIIEFVHFSPVSRTKQDGCIGTDDHGRTLDAAPWFEQLSLEKGGFQGTVAKNDKAGSDIGQGWIRSMDWSS